MDFCNGSDNMVPKYRFVSASMFGWNHAFYYRMACIPHRSCSKLRLQKKYSCSVRMWELRPNTHRKKNKINTSRKRDTMAILWPSCGDYFVCRFRLKNDVLLASFTYARFASSILFFYGIRHDYASSISLNTKCLHFPVHIVLFHHAYLFMLFISTLILFKFMKIASAWQ